MSGSDPILVEFIELHARGITDVKEQLDALREAQKGATDGQVVLAKALADPKLAEGRRLLEQLKRHNYDLLGTERQRWQIQDRQTKLASGATLRDAREQLRLRRESARLDREEARAGLASQGSFALSRSGLTDARQRLQFQREQAAVARLVSQNETRARREVIDSPGGLADARERIQDRRESEGLGRAERLTAVRAEREHVASGGYMADRQEDAKVGQEGARLDYEKSMSDLMVRREQAGNGGLAERLKMQQMIAREEQKVRELEGKVERAVTGVKGAPRTPLGETAGGKAVGAAAGMMSPGLFGAVAGGIGVMNGMAGSVEANRLSFELKLVSRELAGAFKPAIDGASRGLQRLRKGMEGLTPRQQDAIMYGGLAAGAAVGANALSNRLLGVSALQAVMSGGRAVRKGPAETIGSGGIVAAMLAGALAPSENKDLFDERPDLRKLNLEQLKEMEKNERESEGPWAFAKKTVGRLGAGGTDAWMWLAKSAGWIDPNSKREDVRPMSDRLMEKIHEKEGEKRRTLTPADAGFYEIGSGYQRISEALTLHDVPDPMGNKPEETKGLLEKIEANTRPKDRPDVR